MSTREKILEAAIARFGENGFANTSTREISRVAGVSETSIFRLFGNKEEVLRAIFGAAWAEINERCEAIRRNEPDLIEALAAIAADIFLYLRERPQLGRIFLLESRTTGSRDRQATLITPELVRFGHIIEELVEQGQRNGVFKPYLNPRAVRQALIGVGEAQLLGWLWQESAPGMFQADYSEEEALNVLRCLLEGLTTRGVYGVKGESVVIEGKAIPLKAFRLLAEMANALSEGQGRGVGVTDKEIVKPKST